MNAPPMGRVVLWIVVSVVLALFVDQVQEWRAFDARQACERVKPWRWNASARQPFTTHVVCR